LPADIPDGLELGCRDGSGWPRLFALLRTVDETGVSGTGVVAYGARFADGSVALRWAGENPSTAVWGSIDAVRAIHGHHGLTRVLWLIDEGDPG
jgi:hypothetical protein